jgi:hypothetical protein
MGTGMSPEGMKLAFQQLSDGWLETLTELCSEKRSWPKPTTLILDQHGGNRVLPASKKIVGTDCKVLMHWSPSASCIYGLLVPSTYVTFPGSLIYDVD